MRIVRIGFIGMGNMGNVVLSGFLKTRGLEGMMFSTTRQDRMGAVTVRTKVPHTCSNRECAEAVEYLILAVKPQYSDAMLSGIRDVVTPGQVVVSLAPGIAISNVTKRLGGNMRVMGAIPDTPAMLGEGMTDVSCGETSYTEGEKETIRDIFSSCEGVELVEERPMDIVGRVSGSSPAFIYMFVEALAGSGVRYGFPRKTAYAMAAQAVLGSAKMILETDKHPEQLKDEMYSPGGITITDVSILKEYGLRNAVIKTADVCYEKTRRMRQDNDIKS